MAIYRKLADFPDYLFGDDGNVYNAKKMTVLRPNHSGHYCTLPLRNTRLRRVVKVSRHRLMALAWHGEPPTEDAVVHHINEIPGDDRPDNLEWTTHAYNLYPNQEYGDRGGIPPRAVSTRDVVTGEVTHYPSISDAGRALGMLKDSIMYRIRQPGNRVYPDGLQYRLRDDTVEWEVPEVDAYGTLKGVDVKDIVEGTVHAFDSQREACEFLGVCEAVVSMRLSSGDQKLIDKRYIVKAKSDKSEWREVKDPLLEQGLARPVVCFVEATKTANIYGSALQCAKAHGVKTTTLSERLKHPDQKNKVWKDGNRYFYLDGEYMGLRTGKLVSDNSSN